MSATISYKDETIATAVNQTKILKTNGKRMAGDIKVVDVTDTTVYVKPEDLATTGVVTVNAGNITTGTLDLTKLATTINQTENEDIYVLTVVDGKIAISQKKISEISGGGVKVVNSKSEMVKENMVYVLFENNAMVPYILHQGTIYPLNAVFGG